MEDNRSNDNLLRQSSNDLLGVVGVDNLIQRSIESDLSSIAHAQHEECGGLKDLQEQDELFARDEQQPNIYDAKISRANTRGYDYQGHTAASRNKSLQDERSQESTSSYNYKRKDPIRTFSEQNFNATIQPNQGQHYMSLGLNSNFLAGGARQDASDPNNISRLSLQQSSMAIRQEQDLQVLVKQVKDEKAQFVKKQALLEQQIELLKLQVLEAQGRERTQKEMSDRMQQVTREQLVEAHAKLEQAQYHKEVVNEEHPKVKDMLHRLQASHQERLYQEREGFQSKVHELDRQLQQSQHECQNLQRELLQTQQESQSENRSLKAELKRLEQSKFEETKQVKERLTERVVELEAELDCLRSEEQTERHTILNKHIEQVSELNNQIKRCQRESQELQHQLKQAEIHRDIADEQKQHLLREAELRQEDINDMEQAIANGQYQLQQLDEQAKQDFQSQQEEMKRVVEHTAQLADQLKTAQSALKSAKQQSQSKASSSFVSQSGRGSARPDYFTNNTQSHPAAHKTTEKQSRSLSNQNNSVRASRDTTLRQSMDVSVSYAKMCKDGPGDMHNQSIESIDPAALQGDHLYKLQQMVAHYRAQSKRIEVQYRDLKLKYSQDVEKLTGQINQEKKRRATLYEEKIERSNQLLQQIGEKDSVIFNLTKRIGLLQNQIQALGLQTTTQSSTTNFDAQSNNAAQVAHDYMIPKQSLGKKGTSTGRLSKRRNSSQKSGRQEQASSSRNQYSEAGLPRKQQIKISTRLDATHQLAKQPMSTKHLPQKSNDTLPITASTSEVQPNQTPTKIKRLIVKVATPKTPYNAQANDSKAQAIEQQDGDSDCVIASPMRSQNSTDKRIPRQTSEMRSINASCDFTIKTSLPVLAGEPELAYDPMKSPVRRVRPLNIADTPLLARKGSEKSQAPGSDYYRVFDDGKGQSPKQVSKQQLQKASELAKMNNAKIDMQNFFKEPQALLEPSDQAQVPIVQANLQASARSGSSSALQLQRRQNSAQNQNSGRKVPLPIAQGGLRNPAPKPIQRPKNLAQTGVMNMSLTSSQSLSQSKSIKTMTRSASGQQPQNLGGSQSGKLSVSSLSAKAKK